MTIYPSPFLSDVFTPSKLTFDVPIEPPTIDEGGNVRANTTKVVAEFVLDSPRSRRDLKTGEASDKPSQTLEGFCTSGLPDGVLVGAVCTREINGKFETLRLTSIESDSVTGAVSSFGVACSFEILTTSQWGNAKL